MRSRSDMFHLDEQDIDAFFGMYPLFYYKLLPELLDTLVQTVVGRPIISNH